MLCLPLTARRKEAGQGPRVLGRQDRSLKLSPPFDRSGLLQTCRAAQRLPGPETQVWILEGDSARQTLCPHQDPPALCIHTE